MSSSHKTVIILGSARKNGETKKVVSNLQRISGFDLIDLSDYNIQHFDYAYNNQNDDFKALIKRITDNYDVLIFATPVYWYAMSGIMKVFFDRLTDVLTIEKAVGKKLKGKYMGAISCSIGNHLGEHFWLPFQETAAYLDMHFLGGLHTLEGEDNQAKMSAYKDMIESITS